MGAVLKTGLFRCSVYLRCKCYHWALRSAGAERRPAERRARSPGGAQESLPLLWQMID